MKIGWERSAEQRVLALAAEQFGVVTVEQCLERGLSRTVVKVRVARGAWRRIHRGVYSLGPAAPNRNQLEIAALLFVGVGAALSHQTAAARHWISAGKAPHIQVVVPWEVR